MNNGKGNKTALIWEGNETKEFKVISYSELLENVCKFANILLKLGVQKGDRVTIYMSMIPEIVYAMLACARIGAVHSVIFGGFSPESIAKRLNDCNSEFIVTVDISRRGAKSINLKKNVDDALKLTSQKIKKILIVQTDTSTLPDLLDNEVFYHDLLPEATSNCPCVEMNAEDPLFILYTSGSTGPPKGVLHTTGGYLVYASMTHEYSFDIRPDDIYWCTADCGWITGHSYVVYGPLANCSTSLIFEGLPNWPSPARCWEIIDKWNVNIQ